MTIISITADKRIIAAVRDAYRVVAIGGGSVAVAPPSGLTFSELKKVEQVLAVNFPSVVPATTVAALGTTISGNVVGLTIQAAAGTTVITEVVVVGF